MDRGRQHLHRLSVGVQALATRFGIHGHRQRLLGKNLPHPTEKSRREIGQRATRQRATDRCGMRTLITGKAERLLQLFPMSFSPTLQHGHFSNPCQQAQKHQGSKMSQPWPIPFTRETQSFYLRMTANQQFANPITQSSCGLVEISWRGQVRELIRTQACLPPILVSLL
jgi:hypothetical protein